MQACLPPRQPVSASVCVAWYVQCDHLRPSRCRHGQRVAEHASERLVGVAVHARHVADHIPPMDDDQASVARKEATEIVGMDKNTRQQCNATAAHAAARNAAAQRSSAQCSSATQQRNAAARAATCVVTRAAAYAARAATSRSRRDLAWEGGAWECGMGGRRMEVWHGRAAHGSVTWEGGAWKCGMGGRRARVGTLTCG